MARVIERASEHRLKKYSKVELQDFFSGYNKIFNTFKRLLVKCETVQVIEIKTDDMMPDNIHEMFEAEWSASN